MSYCQGTQQKWLAYFMFFIWTIVNKNNWSNWQKLSNVQGITWLSMSIMFRFHPRFPYIWHCSLRCLNCNIAIKDMSNCQGIGHSDQVLSCYDSINFLYWSVFSSQNHEHKRSITYHSKTSKYVEMFFIVLGTITQSVNTRR